MVTGKPRIAQFYLTARIGKRLVSPPGKPIGLKNEYPTKENSEIADFIKPIMPKLSLYLKDIRHFLSEIEDWILY